MPWTHGEICEAVGQTIRANGLLDGYVRLVVTRGSGGLGLNPYLCEVPSMFMPRLRRDLSSDNGLTGVIPQFVSMRVLPL